MNLLINRVFKFTGACAGIYYAHDTVAPTILRMFEYSNTQGIACWVGVFLPYFMLAYAGWCIGGWLSGYKEGSTTATEG